MEMFPVAFGTYVDFCIEPPRGLPSTFCLLGSFGFGLICLFGLGVFFFRALIFPLLFAPGTIFRLSLIHI